MATSLRLFPTYPAKPTFGENIKVQNARDYTLSKTTKTTYCNEKYCNPLKKTTVKTQGELLLLRKTKNLNYYQSLYDKNHSNYLDNTKSNLTFNNSNLNINLITKLDLNNVSVISNNLTGQTPTPVVLNPASGIPYYNNYNIDPSGVLFGNTICGINNYEKFMVYSPPYLTTTNKYIDSL
jgi:hypothetical protein